MSQNGRWKNLGSCLRVQAPCGGRVEAVRPQGRDAILALWWVLEAPEWGEQLIHLFLRGLKVRCSGRGRKLRVCKSWTPQIPRED